MFAPRRRYFILKRPGNRLVRHTESLGIIHYPAFIGRNHDVPGTYDAIHKERQGLAFPTLTGGNIVRVSNIIRTISPFRLPLGIHGIDKTPGNRGMRFQFGSVQSVFRKTAGIDFQHRRVDIDFERLAERIHRLVVKTGKARHIDADIHPLVGLICPFQRGDFSGMSAGMAPDATVRSGSSASPCQSLLPYFTRAPNRNGV